MSNIESLALTGSAHHATGNAFANTLIGGAGADFLDGAGGADTLIGGAGDDTYFIDDAGDVVQELAGGGLDTVVASFDYTLAKGLRWRMSAWQAPRTSRPAIRATMR